MARPPNIPLDELKQQIAHYLYREGFDFGAVNVLIDQLDASRTSLFMRLDQCKLY